jgi:hypothetical protein
MAKKKSARLTSSTALDTGNVAQLPIIGGDGLPVYHKHFTCEKYRFFFEQPDPSEKLPDRENYGWVEAGFSIVTDGENLVGLDFSITLARILTKFLKASKSSYYKKLGAHCAQFMRYLERQDDTPSQYNELTHEHCIGFVRDENKSISHIAAKNFLTTIVPLHPHSKDFGCENITYEETKKPFTELDFDTIVDEKDYSDRVMMQILGYCFYELDASQSRYNKIKNISKEKIGDDYVEEISVDNEVLRKHLTGGEAGFEKLYLHILLRMKNERAGDKYPRLGLIAKIKAVAHQDSYKEIGGETLFLDFSAFLRGKAWTSFAISETNKQSNWLQFLSFKTNNLPCVLALYLMISTGKNQETILSLKRNYGKNGKRPWHENYDVNLGVDEKTSPAQKEVRVIGLKKRGNAIPKEIAIRVPLNSPIFKYMKLYDDIIDQPERMYFFSTSKGEVFPNSSISHTLSNFCASFPILGDDNKELKTIVTNRLRKTFAGHLLLSLVDEIDNAEDLVSKLQDALNHNNFDTTLFSYLMKTGMGNQIINSAIIALTNDMLEKAMDFKGNVREDDHVPSDTAKEVYLCECSDDSNPTHNIPIAMQCKKYDMCLGCERSEVYARHLPVIYYRILQYDKQAIENPLTFSGLLEDRRQIANETIETFKRRHKDGVHVCDAAFNAANEAMRKGRVLIPSITQF